MRIFVAVLLFSGILLFVRVPEILADTEPVSPLHQVRSECDAYPTCQVGCDRPDRRFLVCPRICRAGNVCEKGYIRQSNAADSACIRPADCPPNSRIFKVTPLESDEYDDDDSK